MSLQKFNICINGDANAGAEIGSEPILCVNVYVATDTMLNFYGDANVDVKCKQAFKLSLL